MFTVRRLGVGSRLALALTNTNCIESMISVTRTAIDETVTPPQNDQAVA